MLNELYSDYRVLVFEYSDDEDYIGVLNKKDNKLHICSKKDFFYKLLTWKIDLTPESKLDITQFYNHFSLIIGD